MTDTNIRLIHIEPGNNAPGTVLVVWEGHPCRVETTPERTIIDGTAFPDVAVGWLFDGRGFVSPPGWVTPVSPVPALPEPQKLYTPPEFQADLFTPQELHAIRASTDVVVAQWLRILDDPRLTSVDRTKPSTIAAIDYLASINLLTADRATAIKTGASPWG